MRARVGVVLVLLACVSLGSVSAAGGGGARAGAMRPAPFPSGGRLVFSGGCDRCPGGGPGLFTVRPDGKHVGFLISGFGGYDPRWSPDGRLIAVSLSSEIALVRADDAGFRIVTHPPDLYATGDGDSEPAWFPDGKHLVFLRDLPSPPNGSGVTTSIWSVGVGGRGVKELLASMPPAPSTTTPGVTYEPAGIFDPEVSPDGRRLAFATNGQLWVAKADGTGRHHLGASGTRGEEPRWSPDGRRIAYLDPDAEVLRVLDIGSNRIHTIALSGVLQYAHAWSPDGHWLAVGADAPYSCNDASSNYVCDNLQLWIVNAFDGRKRRILHLEGIHGLDWRHDTKPARK